MTHPNFSFEKDRWKKGFKLIAGADEVGRGCFAGPVTAGVVVFKRGTKFPKDIKIDDSKKLTPKQREKAFDWIEKNVYSWAVGEVGASTINRVGMAKATRAAFRRAVKNANNKAKGRIDFLLIDAFYIPYLRGFPARNKKARKDHDLVDSRARQLAIKNGDEKSFSIAAASIVAKVHRDSHMSRLGAKPRYKRYLWGKNKGYGTRQHGEAIEKYGISKYHRKDFVKTYLSKNK